MAFADAPKCTKRRSDGSGERCGNIAVRGTDVCRSHGGGAPAVRRKGMIRALVLDWQIDLPEVDPADQLRRLISVTAWRQAQLDWLIRAEAATDPDADDDHRVLDDEDGPDDWRRLVKSYVGIKFNEAGSREEYLRVLVAAERAERELCAKLCAQAIAAGLDERRVRLMEEQARAIVGMFDRFAEGLGLTPEQAERVPEVAERVLRSVPTGPGSAGPGALAG